jgi:hypothetical protein
MLAPLDRAPHLLFYNIPIHISPPGRPRRFRSLRDDSKITWAFDAASSLAAQWPSGVDLWAAVNHTFQNAPKGQRHVSPGQSGAPPRVMVSPQPVALKGHDMRWKMPA